MPNRAHIQHEQLPLPQGRHQALPAPIISILLALALTPLRIQIALGHPPRPRRLEEDRRRGDDARGLEVRLGGLQDVEGVLEVVVFVFVPVYAAEVVDEGGNLLY